MEYLLITKDTTHFQKRGYGTVIYQMRYGLAYIPCMQVMARVPGPTCVPITGLSSAR
jgi:hypothetical protein